MYLVKPYIYKGEMDINEHSRFSMPNQNYVSSDSHGLEIAFFRWSEESSIHIKPNYTRIWRYLCI